MYKKIVSLSLLGALIASLFGGNIAVPIGSASAIGDESVKTSSEASVRAIELSPSSIRMTLDRGEVRKGKFKITNRGTAEQSFTVFAMPYQVKDETYTPIFEGTESNPRTQIARWISFEQDAYTLAVDETIEIHFTINVPENAMGGGQYAAIFASADTGATSTINSVGRVGLLLYTTVLGDITEHGEVVSQEIKSPIFGENISTTASVKNTGNADFVARQTMVIKSFFGNKEVFNTARGFIVFPETARHLETEWAETPRLGLFKVTSTIDAEYVEKPNEQLATMTRTVLVMPLFLFIILILTIIALIALVVLKIVQNSLVKREKRQA